MLIQKQLCGKFVNLPGLAHLLFMFNLFDCGIERVVHPDMKSVTLEDVSYFLQKKVKMYLLHLGR